MVNRFSNVVVAMAALLLTQSVFAKGEWDNFRAATPEALFGPQVRAEDSVVAENDSFIVRAGKLSGAAKAIVLQCRIQNTSVEMAQLNNMIMTDGITVSALYAKSNNQLLSVVTQGQVLSMGKRENLIMALYRDCSVDKFSKDYFGYHASPGNGGYVPTPPPSNPQPGFPPPQPEQNCSIDIQLYDESSHSGYVDVKCSIQGLATTTVRAGSEILCENSAYIGPQETKQCEFTRDRYAPTDLSVVVRSKGLEFRATKHYSKIPTYNYPVRAHLVETETQMTPEAENESIPFRGRRFTSYIKVAVQDNDILTIDPQNEIRVKLVNVKTGRIIDQRAISTENVATFKLEGFYEEPRLFGNPHWDGDKVLQPGHNEFVVIVYDAYKNQDTNPVQLEAVSIEIPKLSPRH